MPVLFTEIIVLEGMESKEDQWCKWIGLQKEVFIYCISHLRNVGPWFWFSAGGGCVTLWKQNKTVQSKKLVIWLASDSKKVVWLFLHVTAMSKSSVTITWKIKGGKKRGKNSHQALAVYYRKPFHTSIFSSGYMHSIIHLAGHVLNSSTYQNG